MAVKITRKPNEYFSETAYMYDIAKTSKYFDKSVYDKLASTAKDDATKKYLYTLALNHDKTISDFNQRDYDYLLSAQDKANYTLYKLSDEHTTEMDDYFHAKVQEGIDKETYNSLNGFQKTMASIGGIVGNALNETLLGTVEGLVDLGAVLVGQKDWAAKDFTGVGANREDLQRFSRAYSYLDKNKIWGVANDVVTGIGQMAPMLIPYVGTAIYFGAMAGNTAADAVRSNPDIDYLSLLTYTAAVTGVEYATEKISAGIFGGAGNAIDNLAFKSGGKSLTKLGEKAAGSWVYRVGLNFLSEGMEESIAEFADAALYNALIAQGDENLRKNYSITDILYAGLIGGLIGGISENGRIASTSKLSITKDGEFVTTKEAKTRKLEVSKNLNKTQSLIFGEQISQLAQLTTKSAKTDLSLKFGGTFSQEALNRVTFEEDAKTAKKLTEITLGLAKIYDIAGEEGFKRASDLASGVLEVQQRLASNYIQRYKGISDITQRKSYITEYAKKIDAKVKAEYGKDCSVEIQTEGLDARQLRLQQNFKNQYGKKLLFGKLGVQDGVNKKFGLTIDENTILIDEQQMGQMTEKEILDKCVKEELVHTLQFTRGLITPKTLMVIQNALKAEGAELTKQQLDDFYKNSSGLVKVTEAQAKAICQVMLFDNLTVSKMFNADFNTTNLFYKAFLKIKRGIESSKELRTEEGKVKYNTILKSIKMYREEAAKILGETPTPDIIDKFQLEVKHQNELKRIYLKGRTRESVKGSIDVTYAATNELTKFLRNKKGVKRLDFTESGFSDDFINLMESTNAPSETALKEMINDTSSGNVTGIGNEQRTNDVIEFFYGKNKNIKTIEDVKKILEKDKRGFSPLAYAYVYSQKYGAKEGVKITYATEEAAAKAKAARDPKTARTPEDVRFDVIGRVVDGEKKVDKSKLEAKKSELKHAQQIIDDAIKNNVINTRLLEVDFDFSIENSQKVLSQLEKDIEQVERGYREVQFSKSVSEEGDELGGEESVVDESSNVENIVAERMGESLEDSESIVERLPKVVKELQTDLTTWAERKGEGSSQENELNKLRLVVENVKDLSKSEKKINISKNTQETINQVLSPDFAIQAINDAVTVENVNALKKKIENNKKIFVNMYGEAGYKQIHGAVTTFMKDKGLTRSRKKSLTENMEIALTKGSTELTIGDIIIETDDNVKKTEEYSQKEHVKQTTDRIKAIEGIVEDGEQSASDVANEILKLSKSAAIKTSEQQLTKDSAKEYNVLHATMMVDSVFTKVTEDNYDKVREKVANDPSALALFDEAMELTTGANINNKYSQEFVDKVQHVSREAITAGAQHIALQSVAVRAIKPTTKIVQELKQQGYDVEITEEVAISVFPQLENKPKLIADVETKIDNIKQQIEEYKDDPLKLEVLSEELLDSVKTLKTLKNGTIEDLLDWAFNNTRIFDGLNVEQQKLNMLFDKLLDLSEKGDVDLYIKRRDGSKIPMTGLQKTIYKACKAVRNWRFWSMLCSPVTFVRNWVTNTASKLHNKIVSSISDKLTKHLDEKGKLAEGLKLYGEKNNKDLRSHIVKTNADVIFAISNGESKYNTDEGKSSNIRKIHKKEAAEANGFGAKLKSIGKLYLDWGLETGPLGDQKFVYDALVDYTSRAVVNSKEYLMKDIKAEYDSLTAIKDSLSDEQKKRYAVLEKAVNNPTDSNVFDAIHPDTLSEIMDVCNKQAMKDYYKNSNAFSKWVNNLSKDHPAAALILETVVPFPKSGSNILNTIIDMTPWGFVRGVGKFTNAKMIQTDLSAVSLKQALLDYSKNVLVYKFKSKELYETTTNADGTKEYKPSKRFLEEMNYIFTKENKGFMDYIKAHNSEYNGLFEVMSNEKYRKKVIDYMKSNFKKSMSDFTTNDISLTQQAGIRNMSNAAVGSFYMIAGAIFAALGWVDIEEDDYLGVCINFNDTIRISLSDLSPIAGSFSMAAAFTYGVKNDKNGFKLALNTLYDNTLLGTVENMFRYSSPEKYAENLMVSYATSLIPSVLKLMNKITSGGAVKDKSGNLIMKIIKSVGASIPFVSNAVPNKVNPYTGETQRANGTANWFFNALLSLSPLQSEYVDRTALENEAIMYKAETTGFSGGFEINNKEYTLTGDDKEKYAKYRAQQVNDMFNRLQSGEDITILDKATNKYKTVKYDELSSEEKQRALKSLYTDATSLTKIKYWIDSGNTYVVTDKNKYHEYLDLFGTSSNIVYQKKWSGSKFVEG